MKLFRPIIFSFIILIFVFTLIKVDNVSSKAKSPKNSNDNLIITKKTPKEYPDPEFKKHINNYWNNIFNLGYKESFSLEAPYFRFCVPFDKYLQYVKGFIGKDIKEIVILDIKKISNSCYDLPLQIKYKKMGKESVLKWDIRDRWINQNNQWYHVLRNKIVFPKISKQGGGCILCRKD